MSTPTSLAAQPCILVVEDDWLIREAAIWYFESHGCTVLEAGNGQAAVAFLENGHIIDVLFTDIRLGDGLTGWDVADEFRKRRPEVGIVYTSGNPPLPSRAVPESTFVPKPYDLEAVLQACRNGDQRFRPA